MSKERKALQVTRPSRKATSTAAEAKKLARGESLRLSVELPQETHRAVKARAAMEGQTIKEYVFELLRRDGIPVPE